MEPLTDTRETLAGVPVRLCYRGDIRSAGARGAILMHHGLTACIEGQTKELHSLADHGYLAVGVDAVGHGARRWPDLEEQVDSIAFHEVFLGMVRDTVREIPGLVDELLSRGWAREEALAQCGISMGGFITYATRLVEPRIGVLIPLLGSPGWSRFGDEAPTAFPEKFFPVALLAQNAGEDQSVPPHRAREFHEVLRPHYEDAPERLAYVEFAGCGHFMPEDRWHDLWDNTLAWLARHLPE